MFNVDTITNPNFKSYCEKILQFEHGAIVEIDNIIVYRGGYIVFYCATDHAAAKDHYRCAFMMYGENNNRLEIKWDNPC